MLLAATLLAFYLPTLAPGISFSDGPEIAAAIHSLGVIHPTGYPLFTLVAHGFAALFPASVEYCVRIEIFNALCGTAAGLLTAAAARLLLLSLRRRTGGRRRDVELSSLVAGLLLGLCPLLWRQIYIPEVYPFHGLLVSWAGYSWIRFDVTGRDRYVLLAAFAMGCGLAHHVTMVYLLPAALLYLLARRPRLLASWLLRPLGGAGALVAGRRAPRRRWPSPGLLPLACLLGALPLLSYGYLIWANGHTDGVTWGGIDSLEALYAHATGAQYHGFIATDRTASYYLGRLVHAPVVFDLQFLPVGTIAFFAGLPPLVRYRPKLALLLLSYLGLNLAHGLLYAVGDYTNYYLPGLWCCALCIASGLLRLMSWARSSAPAARRWVAFWLGSLLGLGSSAMLLGYAHFSERVPEALAGLPVTVAAGLLAAAGLFAGAAALYHSRHPGPGAPLKASVLPTCMLLMVLAVLLPAAGARAYELVTKPLTGASYSREVVAQLPRGSVFMVLGDGYLFSLWYQHHVHGRGLDSITIDMGNVRTPWYQRYVYSHYPRSCDPTSPQNLRDPEGYKARCGSFRRRMALGEQQSWSSLGLERGATRRKALQVKEQILRGTDPQCRDDAFYKAHVGAECRCYLLGKKPGVVEEDCVHSYDEGGIVPLSPAEVRIHRVIEDVIDERPIFERNVFTHWEKNAEKNGRGWDGPSHQRPSGDYALLNRGQYNQIVYYRDVQGLDPCAQPELSELKLRPLRKTRRPRYRRRYQPNERPTLLGASFLTSSAGGTSDAGRRTFATSENVFLHLQWFEQHYYDGTRPDRRGKPIRHGLRVCVYDPDGRRLEPQTVVSGDGGEAAVVALPLDATSRPGRYRLRACSVGELGEAAARAWPEEQRRCAPLILEYDFELRAGS